MEQKGVWRTIGGRRIFIAEGQDLRDAMVKSGKFSKYVTDGLQKKMKSSNDDEDGGELGRYKRLRKQLLNKKEQYDNLMRKKEERKGIPNNRRLQEQHKFKLERLKRDDFGSGTYDVNTLEPVSYEKGYQVTFSQIGDNYSNDEYYDLCKEFLKFSTDGKVCAGKFEGEPEVSFNVESREKAIELAQKYNQISIWDWENCDEIKTGGRGRRLAA